MLSVWTCSVPGQADWRCQLSYPADFVVLSLALRMEQSGDLAAPDAVEDETTVPTGPWEEDENEDCPAYHTAAFRMYVMKVDSRTPVRSLRCV